MTRQFIILVAVSWLVSAYPAVRLWRARESVMLKCALTAVLFIPALGPLFFFWIRNFPPSMSAELMDRSRYDTDLLDRFRYRLERSGHLSPLERNSTPSIAQEVDEWQRLEQGRKARRAKNQQRRRELYARFSRKKK
jgi:hypothetical protein